MKRPNNIEFSGDSLRVLTHSLQAVKPEEGCALLLGKQKQLLSLHKENSLRIELIWPCCNVWNLKTLIFPTPPGLPNNHHKQKGSQEDRFAIDPREQILAQQWAREKNMEVLGSAHSHPNGEAFPSFFDQYWTFTSGLSIIIGQSGCIRAWWLSKNQTVPPQELAILELK